MMRRKYFRAMYLNFGFLQLLVRVGLEQLVPHIVLVHLISDFLLLEPMFQVQVLLDWIMGQIMRVKELVTILGLVLMIKLLVIIHMIQDVLF